MGFHGPGAPVRKSFKSASVEVFNWKLLNEVDCDMHVCATAPKDNVCACGCRGRHTIDSMLGIFGWSIKIMRGGVRHLTNHNIQNNDKRNNKEPQYRIKMFVLTVRTKSKLVVCCCCVVVSAFVCCCFLFDSTVTS